MATLGPFRNYLRAANLKSRSKYIIFKAIYAFISIVVTNLEIGEKQEEETGEIEQETPNQVF